MSSPTVLGELKNLHSLPYHFVCSRHAGYVELEQKLQITGLPWQIGLQLVTSG